MKNSFGLIGITIWLLIIRTGRFFNRRILFIVGFIFIFMTQFLMAIGTIKGKVYDKSTKDALPAATVIIKGTSIGAIANLDGGYSIPNTPNGKQTIMVSYIGYISKSIVVTVTEDGTIQQDFALEAAAIEGEVVTVTAQAQGQIQAINQQLASNKIVSIVSEERIQELPDFNAAQAISRLPGVSTLQSSGEANKVVIRGLAPQYNMVAVSGVSLASTGSAQIGATSQGGTSGAIYDDRSVDLSMVTPYMIKSIEVFKSLTPDMNANAIGGFVNMELREAPSGLKTDLMWQSGYTQKSNKYGNFRGVASISDRFLNDNIGAYLLINTEQYDRNADNMTARYANAQHKPDSITGYDPVQVLDVTLNRHIETRKRYGANLILDYKFLTGIVRSINMFSRLNSNYQDYNVINDYKNNNLDFRFRSGNGTTDIGVNSLQFQNDFGFITADMKAAVTYSKNSLPESPFYQFRQTGGVSTGAVPYNTIPEVLATGVNYKGPTSTYLTSISLFGSVYQEVDQVVKADFKVPLNFGPSLSAYVKFGGEYRHNKNANDQSTPYADISRPSGSGITIARSLFDSITGHFHINYDSVAGKFNSSLFTSTDSKLFDAFLNNNFGSIYWAANPGVLDNVTNFIRNVPSLNAVNASSTNPGGWFDGYYQTLPNDYDYRENNYSTYLMSQINIGQNLLFVGGVRYEEVTSSFHTYNLLDGRDVVHQTYTEVTVHPGNHFLLPSLQAKYNIFDWVDVRYSYSQTLARTDYHQLSPHYNISYDRNNVWAGNPNLKPAHSFNHDLLFTFYTNELGLFSVGAFYKEVQNFTYSTQYKLRASALPGLDSIGTYSTLGSPPNAGANLYTYTNNRHLAYIRGFEADLQTRLWYLPFPFNGLLLGLNYTHISSSATYPWRDEYTVGRPPKPVTIVQIDSTRQGRLINQPNNIANVYIGYDYKGFSGKVTFVFQGNSVSGIGTFPEQDGFTDDYYRIDVSIRQILPLEGLQLFLDVNNINNRMNISRQISVSGFTNEQNYGLTANIGVRYAF